MENKKLVLKGRRLFGNPSVNVHAVSKRSGISRTTIYKLLDEPEKVGITLSTLYRFLRFGLGLSVEEILNMRIGDLFDIQEE